MIQGVIESLFMLKEKNKDQAVFISAELIDKYEEDSYTKIPVHVDFVQDYGNPKSYLNRSSIQQFIEWRPEYKNASFVTESGTIHADGIIDDDDIKVETISEVGKMSKRYFNVINPDDVVAKYGADCFRMYEMFLGPIEQSKPWDTNGIDGVSKFLRRLWSLFHDEQGVYEVNDEAATKEELKVLHKTIKKVSDDIESFGFNTCVSSFMVAVNELKKLGCKNREVLEPLVCLLAPFAPFLTEELWEKLGHNSSIHHATFPLFDESKVVEDEIHYPICFNGKKRLEGSFAATATREEIMEQVIHVDGVDKYLEGKSPKKIIVVPGRMINLVV
jgi:leucyl-tRNA synthetase